ncbi:MAG: GMP reductase [Rhodobacteraceae bacterium]|nr:GMP reductase [Paracoccaceae bacterium]
MRSEGDVKLDYSDVLIRPKRSTLSSRKQVRMERRFHFRNYQAFAALGGSGAEAPCDYHGIPIMASNMDGVGTLAMADRLGALKVFTCLVKSYDVDTLIAYFGAPEAPAFRTEHVALTIGINERDRAKFQQIHAQLGERIKYVCIDVANGYSERFVHYVEQFRQSYPHVVIIAGNVVTADQTQELVLNGADIVKVGIGPGSVCTTRRQTGVGYPQLSAVIECADAAHGLGGHIVADGGCTCPGDVAKGFAGGADFVMLGSLLAGTDQGGGEVLTKRYQTAELDENGAPRIEEKQLVQFYGMSSKTANEKHFGGLREYRASEGRTVLTPYKGDVAQVIQDILGGVRSTLTYVGAKKLKHLSKCTTFVRVNNQYSQYYESDTIGD